MILYLVFVLFFNSRNYYPLALCILCHSLLNFIEYCQISDIPPPFPPPSPPPTPQTDCVLRVTCVHGTQTNFHKPNPKQHSQTHTSWFTIRSILPKIRLSLSRVWISLPYSCPDALSMVLVRRPTIHTYAHTQRERGGGERGREREKGPKQARKKRRNTEYGRTLLRKTI